MHNIIGASFYNATTPGGSTPAYNTSSGASCGVYSHWNHRAVSQALWNNTIIANVYNWGRTCSGDPDVAATGGRVATVNATNEANTFAVTGDPHAAGFQSVGSSPWDYGWDDPFAFPYNISFRSSDEGCAYNPEPTTQTESEYSCVQAFWRKGGAGTPTIQY